MRASTRWHRTAALIALCALAAAAVASAHESGARPLSGTFQGRFAGPGNNSSVPGGNSSSVAFEARTVATGPTTVRTGLRMISGMVPATCVKNGRTLRAGRDGSIGILFNLHHSGLRTRPRVLIGDDGRFAFHMAHKANVSHQESYVISVRGIFERKTVSGRAWGTSVSDFLGKCRADRTFTARLGAR